MATAGNRSGSVLQSVKEELCQSLIRGWMEEEHGSLGLVVLGEAGQGKSSLINGLLGKQVAAEGGSLDPETQIVEKYSYMENGIVVTLWDTPGFGVDSDEKEDETLRAMVTEFSDHDPVDLMLYCIRLDGTRWPKKSDIATIEKMTKFFGPNIWQCCQFVLTFANQVMGLCPPGQEREEFFSQRVWQYEEQVRKTLKKHAHLTEEDVKQIRVVPVGDPHQHQNKSWELPGIDDWFLNFWLECTCKIRQSALPTLIKLNKHRITDIPEDVNSPNPPEPYQHQVPSSYAADIPAADTSVEPQYKGLEAPDQYQPASNEPSPMPSLQSQDNSTIHLDEVEPQQLSTLASIDKAESPQPTNNQATEKPTSGLAELPQPANNQTTRKPTSGLENREIPLYRILQNQLKNEQSGILQYIKTYWRERGDKCAVFGHFGGLVEGMVSWLGNKIDS